MANTSAPISEVAVAKMAASILDDYHLTSLDDDTPIGRLMASEFGYIRDEVLQSYPWHFAKKRAVLAPNSAAPAFDWAFAYTLPDDCIRVLPLRLRGQTNNVEVPSEVESGELLTNAGPALQVKYIWRQTNLAKWDPLPVRAFAARMAMYAATRVTGKSTYFAKAQQAYMDAMREARLVDSLTRGTPEDYVGGSDALSVRSA